MARSKATARMAKKNKVAKPSELEAGEILSPDAAKSWKSWQTKKKRKASRDAKKVHKIDNPYPDTAVVIESIHTAQ